MRHLVRSSREVGAVHLYASGHMLIVSASIYICSVSDVVRWCSVPTSEYVWQIVGNVDSPILFVLHRHGCIGSSFRSMDSEFSISFINKFGWMPIRWHFWRKWPIYPLNMDENWNQFRLLNTFDVIMTLHTPYYYLVTRFGDLLAFTKRIVWCVTTVFCNW